MRTAAAVKLRMWEEYKLDDDDDDAGLHKIKPIKGVINSLKLFIFGFDLAVQVPLCVSLGYSRGNNIIIVEYSSNYPNYYYLILMKYSLWKIMDTLSSILLHLTADTHCVLYYYGRTHTLACECVLNINKPFVRTIASRGLEAHVQKRCY